MRKKWIKSIYGLTIALSFTIPILIFYAINRIFDNDEFEAIHTSWKIFRGLTIYVDFFQHHHPLFYYMLLPIIKLCGATTKTLIAARMLMLSMVVGIGATTYKITEILFNKTTALISLFVLYGYHVFITKAIEVRPDVPQVLFGMIAILALFLYLKKPTLLTLLCSALSLSLAFLALQKAIFLIGAIGLISIYATIKKNMSKPHFFTYWTAFSIPILSYLGYHLYSGTFYDYFLLNWLVNSGHAAIPFFNNSSCPCAIQYSFIKTPLIYIFAIIAILFYTKKPMEKYLVFISLVLFGSILLFRSHLQQYLLPAAPVIAILAAHGIYSLFALKRNKNILVTLTLLLITIPPTCAYVKRIFFQNNRPQIERINYVSTILTTDDYVYDFTLSTKSFNLFWRDPAFFWFTGTITKYEELTGYKHDKYALIKKYKPKVIAQKSIEPDNSLIKKRYKRSVKFPDLFILKEIREKQPST